MSFNIRGVPGSVWLFSLWPFGLGSVAFVNTAKVSWLHPLFGTDLASLGDTGLPTFGTKPSERDWSGGEIPFQPPPAV